MLFTIILVYLGLGSISPHNGVLFLISLEKEMMAYSSIFAWKIPRAEGRSRLQFMRSQRVGCYWVTEHIFPIFLMGFRGSLECTGNSYSLYIHVFVLFSQAPFTSNPSHGFLQADSSSPLLCWDWVFRHDLVSEMWAEVILCSSKRGL